MKTTPSTFRLTKIAQQLFSVTTLALCAGHAYAASPCTGSDDLRLASNLATPDRQANLVTTLNNSSTECSRYLVNSSTTFLNVENNGRLGNAILQNGGNLTIGNGGHVWGYAEAGGSVAAFNPNGGDPAAQVWGGQGLITVQQGGTLATALIGQGSTLIVGGASIPGAPVVAPATVGRIQTSGTVHIENGLVDISQDIDQGSRKGGGYNAIAMSGGTTTIINSEVRSRPELNNYGIYMGYPAVNTPADNSPITLNMLNSSLDQTSGGIFAEQQRAGHDFVINLENTSITSDPTSTVAALDMGQRSSTNAVTTTIKGGTLSGGIGIIERATNTNVTLSTDGTTILAPNATPTQGNDANPYGAAVYISGPAQASFGGGSVLHGKVDGLRIGSDSGTSLVQGPMVSIADASTVRGETGAAIHVTRNSPLNTPADPLAWSTIGISGGSTLQGDSGSAILVDKGALSRVMAQDSSINGSATATGAGTQLVLGQRSGTMNGDLVASAGGALTAGLVDTTMTGNMRASGASTLVAGLERATVTGQGSADGAGSSVTLQLGQDAVMNGGVAATNQASANVQAIGSGAVLNGGVNADKATANVQVAQGGQMLGGVSLANGSTGSVSVDGNGSSLGGAGTAAVSVDGGSKADVLVNDGARLASANGVLVNATNASQADVRIFGGTMNGSLLRDATSQLNVQLANGAQLTGDTNANTLAIADTATWHIAGAQPSVGSLTMNGGAVDFNSGTGPFKTLTAASLGGSGGAFDMGLDFMPGQGNDKLLVTGSASGSHTLDPYAEDQGVRNPRNNIVVAQTGGGNANFQLQGGRVDAGIYTYTLQHVGNQWLLVRDLDGDPSTNPPDSNNPPGGNPGDPGNNNPDGGGNPPKPAPEALSPAAKTALNTAAALPFVWDTEMSTLRQRQGDLRGNKAGSGLWVRPFSSLSRIGDLAAPAFDLDQYGIMMGADKRLVVSSGDLYVGGFGSYSYAQADVQGGSTGRINSYGVGAYATWMGKDGWYADGVLKANNFQNSLRVTGSSGHSATGHYSTPAIGASLEVGKKIELPKQSFLEPYAKVSAMAAKSTSEDLDSNFDIENGATRSVQGQLGTLLGKRFDLGNDRYVEPYVKAAVIHEFVNNNQTTLNGVSFNNDLSGTRGLVGAGLSAQLRKNLQVHADVDYSKGGPVDRNVSFNLGVRYVW